MPDVDAPAPDFTLPDHEEIQRGLADFHGRWVVLWWFPKAFTNGCTREGGGFRDHLSEFAELGAQVLGISFDTPTDNRAWAQQNGFTFPLLSDVDHHVGRLYGTERAADDDKPDYPRRMTFVIDGDGVLRKAYVVADAGAHPDEVLADLRALVGA